MEPLQEAIEKARKEREGQIGQTTSLGDKKAEPGLAAEPSGHAPSGQAPSEPAPSEPTPTQPVSPEPNGQPLPSAAQVRYSSTSLVEIVRAHV